MAGQDRKRLTALRVTETANAVSRANIAKQIELMRRANEKGDLTALDAARTAITSARSSDLRT